MQPSVSVMTHIPSTQFPFPRKKNAIVLTPHGLYTFSGYIWPIRIWPIHILMAFIPFLATFDPYICQVTMATMCILRKSYYSHHPPSNQYQYYCFLQLSWSQLFFFFFSSIAHHDQVIAHLSHWSSLPSSLSTSWFSPSTLVLHQGLYLRIYICFLYPFPWKLPCLSIALRLMFKHHVL